MLLPRAKKEMGQPQVGPGFYPPAMHEVSLSEDPNQWGVDTFQSLTRGAEATAKVRSIGRGKKYNLMAQVIPIYGFGILLYILYIMYKLTCRDKKVKSGKHSATKSMERNMRTDDELVRLQERLLQSERLMERIVSGNTRASGSGRRRKSKSTPTKKEEKLLRQLRQISQLMQEGRVEGASPEMEAEEVPYSVDWEGYPEETYPEYEVPDYKSKFERVAPEEPINQPTAEALAERMEQEEEDVVARKLSVVQEEDEDEEEEDEEEEDENVDSEEDENVEDEEEVIEEEDEEIAEEEEEEAEAEKILLLAPAGSQDATYTTCERLGLQVLNELQGQREGGKHITFNDHRDIFHYPKEDTYSEEVEKEEDDEKEEDADDDDGTEVEEVEEEADEDDPVTEAERLQFNSGECPNPEEEAEQEEAEYLSMLAYTESDSELQIDIPKEVSGLRMRNRRET
ncbi:protein RIC-3-like isoform X2 [Corythoichthys intestinalis]|nr:protein RIC-3-like isoform X2 [Corythoichthys intestinalis]